MSDGEKEERRYWVAHARGPNFPKLRERGFTTFFPTMDDYVFLQTLPINEKMLRKQIELGVAFLRDKGELITISYDEMMRMFVSTVAKIEVDAEILVVVGYGANLEGKVLELAEEGQKVRCKLKGFNREYDVWLDRLEVVEASKVGILKPIEDEEALLS